MSVTVPAAPPKPTPVPVVAVQENGDKVVISASGEGEVVLYVDGKAVDNPWIVKKTSKYRSLKVYATARLSKDALMTKCDILTVNVPANVTPVPAVSTHENDNQVVITALGEGKVALYVDDKKVKNPFTVKKSAHSQSIQAYATAQITDAVASKSNTVTVSVPPYNEITLVVSDDPESQIPQRTKSKKKAWIIAAAAAFVSCALVTVFILCGNGDGNGDGNGGGNSSGPNIVESPDPPTKTLSHYKVNLPLGMVEYTGEATDDNIPSGQGIALFDNGDEMDGIFDGDKFEGTYTYNNDKEYATFEGTIEGERFVKGTLTYVNGNYFKGTFGDDFYPENGTEYDKNGNVFKTYKDGKSK